ncbi:amidase [Martelella endophytica]|uniref:Amidase n=1 Tax=Martelella endophytica TaxID=1486262 RepID=A0A0D5LNF3_MAREN|nr:amidase [Martelella endophytica]AJY45455.1 amidase [Martelella endophytica]
MTTRCGPFVTRFETPIAGPAQDGPLAGLSVAVKDNCDVAGYVTGGGNPEWAEEQSPAEANATVVERLLDAGATLVGKTQMDELAYSLMGINARYGTPENPVAPSRVPGGSSSGSVSAVAANLVDIGLGTDTGGSVRLPSAFCGLFGWRPTHGLIPADGILPLAPSYDVPGFMTRDLETMESLADVFCDGQEAGDDLRFVYPADLWRLADGEAAAALKEALPRGDRNDGQLLDAAMRADLLPVFRLHQGWEAWQTFGAFIERRNPDFGPGILERFALAADLTDQDFATARAKRSALSEHLDAVLKPGVVLVYPTAPGPAPLLTDTDGALEQFRSKALTLLSIAGHGGLPQLTLPFAVMSGAPLGLSLVARAGSDRLLIEAARHFL